MNKTSQRGSILISLIIVIPFLILISSQYMGLAVNSQQVATKDQSLTYSQFAADAGLDYAMQQVNVDPAWTNTTGEIQLQSENGVRTTYQVTLTVNSSTSKTLTSVGRSYRPASATTPFSTKTIKAGLRAVTAGQYSVVTGVGGLYMSNSARIIGGDVLVNGEIEMSNSAQIGLSTNPVKVEVAHQNCPDPATAAYPRLCTSGENGQPISLNNTAHIYGTVKANNQTSTANMSSPGLVSGAVTPGVMPTHDRNAQKAAIASTITGTAASCSSGTRNWPANVKITGDVSISNTCNVTINGDAWITGRLTMSNSSRLTVANSASTNLPDIMVDGSSGATFSNSAQIVNNTSNTGVQVLTYWSRASCSPDCTNVTGTDLYNTRNDQTIALSNSASGTESIFYARWSRVNLANSGGIGALIGQTIQLSNTASVTFGTTVGAGATYWVLDGYYRSF